MKRSISVRKSTEETGKNKKGMYETHYALYFREKGLGKGEKEKASY